MPNDCGCPSLYSECLSLTTTTCYRYDDSCRSEFFEHLCVGHVLGPISSLQYLCWPRASTSAPELPRGQHLSTEPQVLGTSSQSSGIIAHRLRLHCRLHIFTTATCTCYRKSLRTLMLCTKTRNSQRTISRNLCAALRAGRWPTTRPQQAKEGPKRLLKLRTHSLCLVLLTLLCQARFQGAVQRPKLHPVNRFDVLCFSMAGRSLHSLRSIVLQGSSVLCRAFQEPSMCAL